MCACRKNLTAIFFVADWHSLTTHPDTKELKELDTTGVEPLMHMSEEVNVLREDVEGPMLSQEEALKNAPHHDNQYFKVPKVIKK